MWAWLWCWPLRRVSWRSAGGSDGPGSPGYGRVQSHGLCGAPKTFSWLDVVVAVAVLQCHRGTVQMKIDVGDGDAQQPMSAGEWML